MNNMVFEVQENSKNYACSVVEISTLFPIEGADKIVRTVVNGNNVVVPVTTQVGQKMLYFVSGTKLSEDYCKLNNLYDKSEENENTEERGFISFKQKRVKAIKLKGIISDGMLMPLKSLKGVPESELTIGLEFTHINGVPICEKYIVPVKQTNENVKKGKQPVKISRLVENQFYFHNDTDNLRKNMHKVNPDDIIGIHYKKHGSSVVIGNVLVKKPLGLLDRVLKRLGAKIVDTTYDIVYSSRKVVKNGYLNPTSGEGFYGEDIWGVVAKEVGKLIPKNWTLYGEILGYTPSGSYIQQGFDYGCQVGEHKFYVYKISVVNEDGKVIFLTDNQIAEYCEKVGLLYKDTFIYYGKARDLYKGLFNFNDELDSEKSNIEYWRENFLARLEKDFNEKDCYMCYNKVPEEGIILRVERLEQYDVYKLKSKRFLLMESEEQEKEVSNIEDAQSE